MFLYSRNDDDNLFNGNFRISEAAMIEDFEKQKEEHPFPVDMFNLIISLNSRGALPKEEFEIIANLLERYLIELLELFFFPDLGIEIWRADGVEVDRSYLKGKYILKMVVTEKYDS